MLPEEVSASRRVTRPLPHLNDEIICSCLKMHLKADTDREKGGTLKAEGSKKALPVVCV